MTTKQLYLRAVRQWLLTALVAALALFLVDYRPDYTHFPASDYGRPDTLAGVGLFFTNALGLAALALLTSIPTPVWLGFLLQRLTLLPPTHSGWQRTGWLLSRLLLFDVGFLLLGAALLGGDYWANVRDLAKALSCFLVTGLVLPLVLNRDLLCPSRIP